VVAEGRGGVGATEVFWIERERGGVKVRRCGWGGGAAREKSGEIFGVRGAGWGWPGRILLKKERSRSDRKATQAKEKGGGGGGKISKRAAVGAVVMGKGDAMEMQARGKKGTKRGW